MESSHSPLVTFIPLAGALLLLLLPRRDAISGCFLLWSPFSLSCCHCIYQYTSTAPRADFSMNSTALGFPRPIFTITLGVDGISMWLVVLTTFLTPLCVLISWNSIHERVKEFFILLLVLETAMIGVFVALDLFLFYFFWEATLIPMALLIGMYGHGSKVYAAVKFFMYTMIASVFMLAAILWLYAKVGTFDFVAIQTAIRSGQVADSPARRNGCSWDSSLPLRSRFRCSLFIPGCPMHTWRRPQPGRCCWLGYC